MSSAFKYPVLRNPTTPCEAADADEMWRHREAKEKAAKDRKVERDAKKRHDLKRSPTPALGLIGLNFRPWEEVGLEGPCFFSVVGSKCLTKMYDKRYMGF